MKTLVMVALLGVVIGILTGCNLAYRPDVDIQHADIQHQSGNTTKLKGEYNAK